MTAIDRCTVTVPHRPHRAQYGPFGVKDCPGVPAAPTCKCPPEVCRCHSENSPPTPAGLADIEHKAMKLTADLWNTLCRIAGNGPSRSGDLAEMATHIHAIQHAVMAQAAARAHPALYRLMGGALLTTTEESPDAR